MPPKGSNYSSRASLKEMVTQMNEKRKSTSSRNMADGVFDDDGDHNNNSDETNNSIKELEKKFWKDNASLDPSWRCVHVYDFGTGEGWL